MSLKLIPGFGKSGTSRMYLRYRSAVMTRSLPGSFFFWVETGDAAPSLAQIGAACKETYQRGARRKPLSFRDLRDSFKFSGNERRAP